MRVHPLKPVHLRHVQQHSEDTPHRNSRTSLIVPQPEEKSSVAASLAILEVAASDTTYARLQGQLPKNGASGKLDDFLKI